MSLLKDRVAIVTGASRGIGRAIAEIYAKVGATVIITGRKQETLDEVARENDFLPGRIVPLKCHAGHYDEMEAVVDTVIREQGHIDVLVNNAGTNIAQGPCLEITETQFDKMVELNLKSVFRLISLVAPHMAQAGSGSIVNIASVAGLRPQREGLLYSMTKAALIMMTKSYAQELGPLGIRVNAIAPGLVQTKLSEFYWKNEESLTAALNRQSLKHIGQPLEVAEIALMLASERSSFLTGQVIVVDGGALLS